MAVRLSTITSGSTVAIACTLVMLATFSTRSARTQAKSGTDAQISALQHQLSAMDRRVKDLEQAAQAAAAADQVKEEPASGGKPGGGTLEKRIAELEAEVRSLQSQDSGGGGGSQTTKLLGGGRPGGPQVLTVKAPFRVLDASGKKVILEVAETSNRPSLRLGDPASGGVWAGVGVSGSGALIVFRPDGQDGAALGNRQGAMGVYVLNPDGQKIDASMTTSKEGGTLRLNTSGKQAVQIDKSSLVFYSEGGSPLSLFGTKDRGKGYMELNDSGGSKMVEAGMLNEHKGYVLATPYRSSVGINGNPSVLMGGAGR